MLNVINDVHQGVNEFPLGQEQAGMEPRVCFARVNKLFLLEDR